MTSGSNEKNVCQYLLLRKFSKCSINVKCYLFNPVPPDAEIYYNLFYTRST